MCHPTIMFPVTTVKFYGLISERYLNYFKKIYKSIGSPQCSCFISETKENVHITQLTY
jgi:hypothetical protein